MVRYLYLRDGQNIFIKKDGTQTKGNPVAVVASEVDRATKTVVFALAVPNSKHDRFRKEMGRKIALGRLSGNSSVKVVCENGVPEKGHQISKLIMESILNAENVNSRARKAAKRWLKFSKIDNNPEVAVANNG